MTSQFSGEPMVSIFGPTIRTIERNRPILSAFLILVLAAAFGCGQSVGGPIASAGGGTVSGNGGSTAGSLGGATVSGANGARTGGATNNETGGITNSAQIGGGPGQGGAGVGGATQQNGGATSSGGIANQGGARNVAGNAATGGANAGGSQSGGSTATGDKATGGTSATGGAAAAGSAKATGGTSVGGASTGGAKATGGATATGGTTTTGGSAGTLAALTIYLAGDSTVSAYTDTTATNDQAGWGQMLKEIFNTKVTVVNAAAGGRTAYWFYLEGAAATILNNIKAGDYFFIQFGTNDQNTTATFTVDGTTYPRFADAQTTFKTQLKQYYLDPTKAKGAIPVLVTPPPRNSAYCSGGNGLGAYATAMKELGAAESVAVLDNNGLTFSYLSAICPKPTTAAEETFFKNDAGTIDSTHFQENGARRQAGFIGSEIKRLNLGLAGYLL